MSFSLFSIYNQFIMGQTTEKDSPLSYNKTARKNLAAFEFLTGFD